MAHLSNDLSNRASRGIALAALTVACVLFGPTPQVVRAIERIYAVQVHEDEQRRRRPRRSPGLGHGLGHGLDRGSDRPRRPGPPGRRPTPSRP